ncbi:MAG TPA: exo-alpha-sialidase, partial [Anaerolineae bacterium]|nr:exo-alpha-sialidase [Anaerolineae bacterium]
MTHSDLRHNRHSRTNPRRWRRKLCLAVALLAMLGLTPISSYAQQASNSWSEPIDATQGSTAQMGSFDILLCDPYQNAYLLWAEQANNGAAVYLRTDTNDSWSAARDVIVTPGAVIFGLAAAIGKPTNTLHLIWADQYLRGSLYYSQVPLAMAEEPRSWTEPQLLAQNIDWAAIKTDSKGTVHVVYGSTDDSGVEHTIYHIESADNGKTWSEPNVVYSVISALPALIRPELAIDGRDRLHVGVSLNSYEYGAYSEVGYIRSEDGGQTWSPYRQIQNKGSTFQGVAWIAPYAFGDDEIHLTWHDPRRMHTWSTDGGKTWHDPQEIMSLPAAFGGRNELTQDSAGVVHAVTAVGNGVYSAS